MENLIVIFLEVLIASLVLEMGIRLFKRLKTKRVMVIEDNPSDIDMYKLKLNIPDCIIEYRQDIKGILQDFLKKKPDAVIIDYHLSNGVKGTQLIEFCDRNDIPALLVTGDDREIMDIAPERIIRKEISPDVFEKISNWAIHQIA